MTGFEVEGWSAEGIQTTPVTFVDGPTVHLAKENSFDPPGIASQIRGFAPKGSTLPVTPIGSTPPSMDGSLAGWESATAAKFAIDGLNVDQPAQIETRLMYDQDNIYVNWVIDQNGTGWRYPTPDLDPASRMFIHGRGATTCSLYIQGNVSAGYNRKLPTLGRPGDARFVFGVFNSSSDSASQMSVLGVYPFWNSSFGPATPVTYEVSWHNVSMANVVELKTIKKGFTISPDGYEVRMSAVLPRSLVPWLSTLKSGMLTGGDMSCNVMGFEKGWWMNYDLYASEITWD